MMIHSHTGRPAGRLTVGSHFVRYVPDQTLDDPEKLGLPKPAEDPIVEMSEYNGL